MLNQLKSKDGEGLHTHLKRICSNYFTVDFNEKLKSHMTKQWGGYYLNAKEKSMVKI
jgi:hypothetical protein